MAKRILVPIVVTDNLGPQKNEHTLELIAQAGATVRFLPAYSPDMLWSKVKAILRAVEARTVDELPQSANSSFPHNGGIRRLRPTPPRR